MTSPVPRMRVRARLTFLLDLARPSWALATLAVALPLAARIPALAVPWLWMELVDELAGARRLDVYLSQVGGLAVLFALVCALGALSGLVQLRFAEAIAARLRPRLLDALARREPPGSAGDAWLAHFTHDVPAAESLLSGTLPTLAAGGCAAVASAVAIAAVDPLAMGLAMLSLPLALVGQAMVARRVAHRAEVARASDEASLGAVSELVEARVALRDVGGVPGAHRAAFERTHQDRYVARRRLLLSTEALQGAGTILGWISVLGILALLYRRLAVGSVTVGGVIAILEYLLLGGREARLAQRAWATFQATGPSVDRLAGRLRNDPLDASQPQLVPEGFAPRVLVEGVRAGYGERPVLDACDLVVEAEERFVLFGPSGSGKTTLAYLLLGDIRPDAGAVRIGGHDPVALTTAQRPCFVGVLRQDPALVSGTIADNLRLAAPNVSDQRVRELLSQLGLEDLGPSHDVGPRGAGLSRGQRQRVALARLFLNPAKLWILDEPTTGLDEALEDTVVDAIAAHSAGRTVVILTHSDRVLRLASRWGTIRDSRIEVGGTIEAVGQ